MLIWVHHKLHPDQTTNYPWPQLKTSTVHFFSCGHFFGEIFWGRDLSKLSMHYDLPQLKFIESIGQDYKLWALQCAHCSDTNSNFVSRNVTLILIWAELQLTLQMLMSLPAWPGQTECRRLCLDSLDSKAPFLEGPQTRHDLHWHSLSQSAEKWCKTE